MRKLIRKIKQAIRAMYCPYTVVAQNGKEYHCWTYAEALHWTKACNSRVCGTVGIYNWLNKLVAVQYPMKEIKS